MYSALSGRGNKRVPGGSGPAMNTERPMLRIPVWVRWIAQDSSGAWWGYSVEPSRHDGGWYENEVGRCICLGAGNPRDWRNSLRTVRFPPGVKTAVLLQDRTEIRYGEHLR